MFAKLITSGGRVAAIALALLGGPALAMGSGSDKDGMALGSCVVTAFFGFASSDVAIQYGGDYYSAGGTRFGEGNVFSDYEVLTPAILESCGLTDVTGFSADPAQVNYLVDQYYGFSFTATEDGQTYDYEFALVEQGPTTRLVLSKVATGSKSTGGTITGNTAQAFQLNRLNQLLALQPDLANLINNSQPQLGLTVSGKNGTMAFATPGNAPVWLRLDADWTRAGSDDSHMVLASAGIQRQISTGLTLGAMVELHDTRATVGAAHWKGNGWLVGPYAVWSAENGWAFQGSLLTGQSQDDLRLGNDKAKDIGGEQWIARAKLSRVFALGNNATATPSVTIDWGSEKADAFVTTGGTALRSQSTELTQITAGVDGKLPLSLANGQMTLTGGLYDVWSDTSSTSNAAYDGHRGRLRLGLDHVFVNGAVLSFAASADGLALDGYESRTLSVQFSHRF